MPLLTGAIQRGCTDNTGGVHACLHAPISFRARACVSISGARMPCTPEISEVPS